MKKLIFLIFLLLVYTNSYAVETTGTPVIYRVIVNKIELYNSTTSKWEVLGEGNVTFNIASVAEGQKAGNYVSNSSIPEGLYTEIRCTVSRTMYIKGEDDAGRYTATGSNVKNESQANATDDEDLYDVGTVVVTDADILSDNDIAEAEDDDYFIYTQDLSTSVTITKGLAITLRMEFDVDDVLNFEEDLDEGCYIDAPEISIETIE